MFLLALFVGILGLHAALSLWVHIQIRRFLAETPTIADERSLQRYKDLVRPQMYAALAGIGILLAGLVVSLLIVARYGCGGFFVVMLANAWMIGASLYLRRFEVRARSLEVTSEALEPEYRRVSAVWVKKPLPDF
jgi:hypothetical protein